ncbi:hypothetical protein SAMN04487987_102155 [Algibacter pectinivorans]|uniref:Uncharacterized protein n=1 Tax=Algibacter pectinivorans TaxID=870482 RepID=A0A1I1NAP2_9FLAO|nr:hypothetical protein SAMN04487987_102155 [Algibacter pectinivorans]
MFISQAYYCSHIKNQNHINIKLQHSKNQTTDFTYPSNKTFNTTSNSPKLVINWNKKTVFYTIWITLNLLVLSILFHFISKTDWLFLYFVATFIYCSLYWMLAERLFNKLFVKN